MTANDFLTYVYHYRENPTPTDVHHALSFIETERLIWNKDCATAVAGVVTALCDRHPIQADYWFKSHRSVIAQAVAIRKNSKCQKSAQWAEYLVNRWLILANDESTWDLLYLCHYAASDEQRNQAQSACDKICRAIEGKSLTDSKGNLVGKVYFEDMRLQMVRLATEFRSFKTSQRHLAFSKLPFSEESKQAQLMQTAGLGLLSPLIV